MNSTSSNETQHTNADQGELARFNALANTWWERDGAFKALHDINPLRLNFIEQYCPLAELNALDVGCGGGLLSEGMSWRGARVTGIDLASENLAVAREHAAEQALAIDYQEVAVETLAEQQPGHYDVVTCLEMLEHVPDPASIVQACATLVKPGGHVFFSTLNRNPKSYLLAIVGAEYILNMVPRGTHDYLKFIKPSELAGWARKAGLQVANMTGLHYNPVTDHYHLNNRVDVNYFMHTVRPL